MKSRDKPTYEEIAAVLNFEPATGLFSWAQRPREDFKTDRAHRYWSEKRAGTPALYSVGREGYKQGFIFNKIHSAHRVAWLLFHGTWPEGQIDHIDGCRSNNKIENLRDVTQSQNLRNRNIPKNNKSGMMGVHWVKRAKLWNVQLAENGKKINIGYFKTFEDACEARRAANEKYGYSERHGVTAA